MKPLPRGHYALWAVDLGKRKLGCAVFLVDDDPRQGRLLWARTVRSKARVAGGVALSIEKVLWQHTPVGVDVRKVCEWPRKYRTARIYHKDIDSLLDVGRALGPWFARLSPHAWKGNVPKAVHHRRVRAALAVEELSAAPALVPATHDAWDAIGIGLFALGRTRRGGAALFSAGPAGGES